MTSPRATPLGVHPALWLLLLTVLLHGQHMGHPFVGDDLWQIARLPARPTGALLVHAWTTDHWGGHSAGLYRPVLHTLWLGEVWLAGPRREAVVRLLNLALLWAAAAGLSRWAHRMGLAPAAALLAGAVIVAHPAVVEVVNRGVGQGELITALLTLAALALCLGLAEGGRGAPRRLALLALVLFAGSLVKETMYLVPAICLALMLCARPVPWGRAAAVAAASAPALGASLALRLAVLGGRFNPAPEALALGEWPWPARITTALGLTARYALQAGVPQMPAIDHDHLVDDFPPTAGWWLAGAALIVAAVVAAALLARRHRRAPVALVWAGAALAPALHLVPMGSVYASRHLWPALLPLAWAGVWSLERAADRSPAARRLLWRLAVAWLAVAALVTWAHGAEHRSGTALWRAAVWSHPDNAAARVHLATALLTDPSATEADRNEAWSHIEVALEINPRLADAWALRGRWLLDARRLDEAEAAFAEALRLRPDHTQALFDLGVLRTAQGRWQDARTLWQRVLTLDPLYPNARLFLARLPAD